jgi:phosphohistidine swiveling domain-containing protein
MSKQAEYRWQEVVNRPHPPLFIGFLFMGSARTPMLAATGLDCGFSQMRKSGTAVLLRGDELTRSREAWKQRVRDRGLAAFRDYAERLTSAGEEVLNVCRRLGEREWVTDSDLAEFVADYGQSMTSFAPFLLATVVSQTVLDPIAERLVKSVSTRFRDVPEPAIRQQLLRPVRKTEIDLAREVEEELTARVMRNHALRGEVERAAVGQDPPTGRDHLFWQDVDAYLTSYSWLTVNYYRGWPDTRESLSRRLLRKPRPGRQSSFPSSAELTRSFTSDQKAELEVIQEFFYLRSHRLLVFFKAHRIVAAPWAQAAHTLGMSVDELVFGTHTEIIAALRGANNDEFRQTAADRRTHGTYVEIHDGQMTWTDPPERGAEENHDGDHDEVLAGRTAHSGRIRGIVRNASEPGEAADLTPGEILVTTMTTPAYTSSLVQAGGLITSEGGLLSHAAVLSRELGLPCVTGVTDAHRLLKTGDLVELRADSDRGEVDRLLWRKGVRRPSPTLWKYFSFRGQQTAHMSTALGLPAAGLDSAKSIDHQTMLASAERTALVEMLSEKVRESPAYYDEVANRCYHAGENLTATAHQIANAPSVAGDGDAATAAELGALFAAYQEATLGTIPFRYGLLELDALITRDAERAVAGDLGISIEDARSRLTELAPQPRDSFEAAYKSRVQQLSALWHTHGAPETLEAWIDADPGAQQLIDRVLDEFAWLPTSYFTGEPLTAVTVFSEISSVGSAEQSTRSRSSTRSERAALAPATVQLLTLLSRYLHLRSYRISVCYRADYLVRPMLELVARRLEVPYGQLINMTGEEIERGLREGVSRLSPHELGAREVTYDLYMANGHIWVRSRDTSAGRDIEVVRAREVPSDITGRTAYPGTVEGRVVLVAGKRDIDKIQEGVVVVSSMTTTDLTSALERAAAIVTDEGGLTSHAALISRENRIVCVVGTGVATQLLRDGDHVRVTATSQGGVITVLAMAGSNPS